MTEFMADNNACGQNLLQIVAVGNAIIAELLRLKDFIPDVFRLETKDDQSKYGDIILDFNYFKYAEMIDKKIENNPTLLDLDDELRINHLQILTRFYQAFESIQEYVINLKNFVNELNDGQYIQQTVETVLQNEEGKQLLCESLYLYGSMLLIVDMHIAGVIRERLLVAYYRYGAQKSHGDSNIDDVCKLLRSTEFSSSPGAKRIPNYPEEYFRRVSLDSTFIELIIARLRADDIYSQISVYPLSEHRSTALANQASMLYVCLFFAPVTLIQHSSRMREIVDKFFSDNWIVSIYMGITVNLIDAWEPYKAAKTALANCTQPENVKLVVAGHQSAMQRLIIELRAILKEGLLTELYVLTKTSKIIALIRESNVVLRWMMLHTEPSVVDCSGNKRCRNTMELVIAESGYNAHDLYELLLNTSQLELRVRDIFKVLFTEREERWKSYKQEAADRINELSMLFSGNQPLVKFEKNNHLQKWFDEIYKEIDGLNDKNPTISGRKCVQLIQALEEVQEFHNLEANMQVKQHLIETRKFLHQMIHILNIKEDFLINLQLIGDFSYAWRIVDKYTNVMQKSIKKQPNLVIKLRATFMKLASALEIPLMRINQAHSEDLMSVSQYYSTELVTYVRQVVQIIPETIFGILAKIIALQTDVIKEIPTRLEKEKLKGYAQLDERYAIAKLTYAISVFTEGVLMMQSTLVGVIELDPKQLLEDGIRKELVKNLSQSLHSGLNFGAKPKQSDLESQLTGLAKTIDGYRRSFEYIQDYLNIYGLKIWQEEISRIINFNVEKECNTFLRNKIYDWQSIYQNKAIPIPAFPPIDQHSLTFIGRLGREILRQTDPKSTIFVELHTAWFDYKNQKELVNSKIFAKISEATGPAGLIGLDKLYSFMIVTDLQQLMADLKKNLYQDKVWQTFFNSLYDEISPTSEIIISPGRFYSNYVNKFAKIWPPYADLIVKIGQKQLLRKQIAYEMNISCCFNSKNLESSLRTMNDALLIEIKMGRHDPNNYHQPSTEFISKLNKYIDCVGLYDPFKKIYTAGLKNGHNHALFVFLMVIGQLPKMQYSKIIGSLIGRKVADHIDGYPFVVGIVTLLKQSPKELLNMFVECVCQYAVSLIDSSISGKHELTGDSLLVLHFLEIFIRTAEISREIIEKHIPEAILNQYEFLSSKSQKI